MASDSTLQRALDDAQEGRIGSALASMRLLVKRKPNDFDAAQVLGMLLLQAGEVAQAIHHLGRAVAAAPNVAGYRNNYANSLLSARRPRDAAAEWRKAIELDPTYSRAYLGLVLACAEVGDSVGAIEAGRCGLALNPDWPELSRNLASVLKDCGRIDEALAEFSRAIAKHPLDSGLRSSFLMARNYSDAPTGDVEQAHREYAQCVRSIQPPAHTDPSPDRPLHIGILSGDMRTHSVAFFAESFMRHRPTGCKLTVFSSGHAPAGDMMRARLITLADEWVDAVAINNAALDRAIRSRQIDLLVELGGHTSGGRMGALDSAPAPVIITAIGYPNTTGHPAVGWRIVDSTTDVEGSDAHCTERLLRIDPCFLCYSPPSDAPEPALPTATTAITFGSFNLAAKITNRTMSLWAAVLGAVPDSRLLIKCKSIADPGTREFFLERLRVAGIAESRVDLLAYTAGLHEHWSMYSRVYVALDTTPYNGTTTTCEALWMGVPVVTIAGDRHAARVGASLLDAAGHPEWVAKTPEEFVSIAAGLATDRARLASLRAGLRGEIRASPLCDQVAYARRFHGALRDAWRAYCVESTRGIHG